MTKTTNNNKEMQTMHNRTKKAEQPWQNEILESKTQSVCLFVFEWGRITLWFNMMSHCNCAWADSEWKIVWIVICNNQKQQLLSSNWNSSNKTQSGDINHKPKRQMINRKGRFVVQERGANCNSAKADLSCRKGVWNAIQKSQIKGSMCCGIFPDCNEGIPKHCLTSKAEFRWLNHFRTPQHCHLWCSAFFWVGWWF